MRLAFVVGRAVALCIAFIVACASLSDASPSARGAESSAASALHTSSDGTVELRAPSSPALLVDLPVYRAPDIRDDQVGLFAYHFTTYVYARPEPKPRALGVVRRGTLLRATGPVDGPGCPHGKWYAVKQLGYACLGRGFTSTPGALADLRQLRPDISRALPFKYGKVSSRSALRYYRIPSEAEARSVEQALAKKTSLPDFVVDKLDGDFFVALDRQEGDGQRRFYRTVSGRYLRVGDVELKPEPTMQGELLRGEMQLPLAFVYDELSVPLLGQRAGETKQLGRARKHARFRSTQQTRWEDKQVVVSARGYAVERQHLRIARRHQRPKGVGGHEPWLHVELGQQTLVAYRGDEPVFATLVSTGRAGYDTPTGLFHIREKHKTRTMRGSDSAGVFEVAEVPWTMFYQGSYALHGAYWHNEFGNVRSHGCINLAPVDARWLFKFTEGTLPTGWHALRGLNGTALLVTQES